MRRLWLLISFLSFSAFADDGERCSNLRKYAQELEKKIQNQKLSKDSGKCKEIPLKDLGILDSKSLTFQELVPLKEGELATYDYRCKDYSAVEAQLKLVENELALFKGIADLKLQIANGVKTIEKFKDKDIASKSTKKLFENLEIAQTLELFFATNNDKSENILSKITKDKEGWKNEDLQSFKALLDKYCIEFNKNPTPGKTVCSPGFTLPPQVFKELEGLAKLGKNSERKFIISQVQELSRALKIKKGKDDYSFDQLVADVKKPEENTILPDEDLKKLQAVNFYPDSDISFLTNIKTSLKEIESSKPLTEAQAIPQKFTSFLNELKQRHMWEMKSKLSLVFHQLPGIYNSNQHKCLNPLESTQAIETCLDNFEKETTDNGLKSTLGDIKQELKISIDHDKKLDDLIKNCVPTTELNYPPECLDALKDKEVELLEKSNYLNAIKTKMLQDVANDIELRNFALEQLHSSECEEEKKEDTSINNCSADLGDMAKEAVALSKDTSDIVFVLQNPKNQTNIDEICNKETSTTSVTASICTLRPQKKDEDKKVNPDFFQASVDPGSRNRGGEDFSNFAKSALSSLATALTPPPKPMNQPNPYQQNYPMMPPPPQGKYIVSQILEPALYTGYGQYRSHPGLTGYAPSGPSGRAAPYTFSTSSYFNYPVGQ